MRLVNISNIPSMNINDYKYLGIYTKDAIYSQSMRNNGGDNPKYTGDMRPKNKDIYDDNITECTYCVLVNLNYDISNNEYNRISYMYGTLNSGWSGHDENNGMYNCYWRSMSSSNPNTDSTIINNFFKKITFTLEDNGYGENEIIINFPDYQIKNIWNPYTKNYFSKELIIGTSRYSVVGILK